MMKNDFGLNNINHTQNHCVLCCIMHGHDNRSECMEKAVQFPVSTLFLSSHNCNHKPHMVWHKVSRSDIFQYFGISFVCLGKYMISFSEYYLWVTAASPAAAAAATAAATTISMMAAIMLFGYDVKIVHQPTHMSHRPQFHLFISSFCGGEY